MHEKTIWAPFPAPVLSTTAWWACFPFWNAFERSCLPAARFVNALRGDSFGTSQPGSRQRGLVFSKSYRCQMSLRSFIHSYMNVMVEYWCGEVHCDILCICNKHKPQYGHFPWFHGVGTNMQIALQGLLCIVSMNHFEQIVPLVSWYHDIWFICWLILTI